MRTLTATMLGLGLLLSVNSYAITNQTQPNQTRIQAPMQTKAELNQAASQAFLDANKKKPGVTTLPDGLQYKIIKQGTGAQPSATDNVKVHYKGTLIDGTEFDSSYKRGEPATFPLNAVISGWTEALQLMKVGSKWEIYIPANLAYGEQAPAVIGPNQALIFTVELLDIKK